MFHLFHKWEPQRVHHFQAGFDYDPRTRVYLKCGHEGCPAVKVKKIKGHWTVEELVSS